MNDEYKLIQECAANNRLSQEKLYYRFYPALMLLCKRFFSDDHKALETLNDGMMKVYRNISSFDSRKGELFNWVYTVIRNTALDKLKIVIPAATKELNGITENAYEDKTIQNLEWKDMYKLLDNLPAATRAVCNLFYIEGFSIKDISDSLEISAGTVKWHLSETRKKLKPVFEKYFL